MYYYLLILLFTIQGSCYSAAQQIKTERKPFQKSSAVIKSPTEYLKRETANGEYDPKPRMVLIDEKSGKYELRWIGYDGKEKIIKYQRADAINALVEARLEKSGDAKFVYKYKVKNLPDSPTYLSSFTVQTLSKDVTTSQLDDVFIGDMSTYLRDFKEGIWWRYAVLEETATKVEQGESIEFSLVSSALPGIVGCRATAGNLTLKGAGEHVPTELEASMLGYEEWAKGYTIGPIDSLASLTKSERAEYLLKSLPKFQEAGWISDATVKKYEIIFKNKDLVKALKQAKTDLKAEIITSEAFHIIEAMNQ